MESSVTSASTGLVSACRAWLLKACYKQGKMWGSCLVCVPDSAAVLQAGAYSPSHSRFMGVNLSNSAAVVDGEIGRDNVVFFDPYRHLNRHVIWKMIRDTKVFIHT